MRSSVSRCSVSWSAKRSSPSSTERRSKEGMQVYDFADDLKVSPEALIALLRQMGIPVADEDATITDAQVSKVLAKVEKERRAGHKDPAKAIAAALEDASPSAGKRRRRKKE